MADSDWDRWNPDCSVFARERHVESLPRRVRSAKCHSHLEHEHEDGRVQPSGSMFHCRVGLECVVLAFNLALAESKPSSGTWFCCVTQRRMRIRIENPVRGSFETWPLRSCLAFSICICMGVAEMRDRTVANCSHCSHRILGVLARRVATSAQRISRHSWQRPVHTCTDVKGQKSTFGTQSSC
jgi:hypothetical protein